MAAENRQPKDITDVHSESGIIASLILDPKMYFFAEDYLQPEHFSFVDNKAVYTAIMNLVKQGVTDIDPSNIVESWKSRPDTRYFADMVSIDALKELESTASILARRTREEYNILVKNVMDTAFRRDMLQQLKQCERLCYDGTEAEDDIRSEIYRSLDRVMSDYSIRDSTPQYYDIVDTMWDEIKARQGSGYAGIPFKFNHLNDYVTIEKGELIIFGAQQKVGKSIMLLNCAVDLLEKGLGVLYIDSELSDRLFTARILSHLSGVEYRNLTSGHYTQEEEDRIVQAKEWIKRQNFCHIYMPFFDEQTIYTTVKRQHHLQNLDVLIIDYFKSTGKDTDAFATYAAMGRVVDLVKNEICGDMNIAGIGAAQATANNKLADSAKIARNASTIIMLMDKTPEEIQRDNESGKDCGNKKAVVAINRNGMQHADGEYIDLQFNGNLILYEEAKDQHIPQVPF